MDTKKKIIKIDEALDKKKNVEKEKKNLTFTKEKTNGSKINKDLKKTSKVKDADNQVKDKITSQTLKKVNEIKEKIESLDVEKFDEEAVKEVLKLIDKEVEKVTIKMAEEGISNEELKTEADLYAKFAELNKMLLEKISILTPFESFFYFDEVGKEKIVREFFENINNDIHLLDFEKIDLNLENEEIIKEKNNIVSESLINVLESNLNINFSEFQKSALKKDFCKIALSSSEDMQEILEECDKIKTVSSIKLVNRPSYKNFISKSELKQHDPSKKLSTIRLNFLNYVSMTKKQKVNAVNDSLTMQLKSIREILELEKEEVYKKLKILFLLIALSLVVTTAAPTAGALGIITIGSAAAFMQSKVIMADNKIKRIEEEMKEIENGTSKLTENTLERLEETTKELLDEPVYKEIADLYVKKKKEALKEKELKEKIEKQMREIIINNLTELDKQNKEKIINKINEKYNSKIEDKIQTKENQKENNISFDVQLEV